MRCLRGGTTLIPLWEDSIPLTGRLCSCPTLSYSTLPSSHLHTVEAAPGAPSLRPPAHTRMYHAMGSSPFVPGALAVRPVPRRPGPLAPTPLARPSLTATPARVGAPAPPASPASCCADAPASLSECPSPGRHVPRPATQPTSARVHPAPVPSASNADTGSDTGGGSTGGGRAWVRGYVVSMGQLNLWVWRVRWRGLSCPPDVSTPNEDIQHDLDKCIMT